MKTKIYITSLLFGVFIILSSCKVEPKDINYGEDHCINCDMTVVDKSHSAEYVTKKGRAYMFDAIECLVWKIDKEQNEDKMSYLLVADYTNPGVLIDAKTATYLISEKIKSPMGANLSAFSSKETAQKVLSENDGQLYTWSELKIKIKR
jgi:copper chaperone NosL